jgi:hypothetical protein
MVVKMVNPIFAGNAHGQPREQSTAPIIKWDWGKAKAPWLCHDGALNYAKD